MTNKSENIELSGSVIEVLPNSTFKVKLENMDHIILCYLGGKLKLNKIKIVIGDNVKIETSPYDLTKGRVVYRL